MALNNLYVLSEITILYFVANSIFIANSHK